VPVQQMPTSTPAASVRSTDGASATGEGRAWGCGMCQVRVGVWHVLVRAGLGC